ncbi:MAG: SulP family inorganic anion transporter [Myxococcales bacterium]|nr:SulP family inorganic anion transporter [Myxococcales bacterium]
MKRPERLNARFLGREAMASVVVFLVALPLCMGIAMASGVPAERGLVTGIIGGLVVGLIGGSPLQVSGPAAGLAVIVWEVVNTHGLAGLAMITLLAGVIQLVAGTLRTGRWFQAVSPAVIYGMLAGIGLLIFSSQFHMMVDDSPRSSGLSNLLSIPVAIYKGIFPLEGTVHHLAAGAGLLTLVTLVAWNRYRPARLSFVPGPLVAVVVATALANLLSLPIRYVEIPDSLLGAVALPTADSWALLMSRPIIVAAVGMAIVASAETLLCATAVDRMHDGVRTHYDRELSAQGVGNILAGLLGALPMTGVIVRSSANVEAGATTRTSAILHGVWLLMFVAAAPFMLELIPTSSLAAILVYTGYRLVNVEAFRKLGEHGRAEQVIYGITVVAIIATDLLTGVMTGFALAVLKVLHDVAHVDIDVHSDQEGRYDMEIRGAATFLRAPQVGERLLEIPRDAELHVHLDGLLHVDQAIMDQLVDWERQAERAGGRLVLDWDEVDHARDYRRRLSSKLPGRNREASGARRAAA